MIDQCIFEVYNRDKKVFIPEFGAIIYSQFNDETDFNELLTFDDGMVIEEIQKQQSLPEEEARMALNNYVRKAKSILEEGKSHYIAGIGYITKDEQGTIIIQKEILSPDAPDQTIEAVTPDSDEIVDEGKIEEIDSDIVNEDAEEQEIEIANSTDLIEEEAIPETSLPEKTPVFPGEEDENDEAILSVKGDDEFVQEDELEIHETESERGRGLKLAFLIIIPIVLVASGAYYYFNYYITDKEKANSNLVKSVQSSPQKPDLKGAEKPNEELKTVDADNTSAPIVSNSQIDQLDEGKTYCLIMGSFKVESNADNYQQQLKQKGLYFDKFKGRKNFYFIGIQNIEGKSNAVEQLSEIKSKIPSAWIYNKDLL